MTTSPNPYRGFRFPADVIERAVWLYHCFSLSLRDIETILAARGIVVSYESSLGARIGSSVFNDLRDIENAFGAQFSADRIGTSAICRPDASSHHLGLTHAELKRWKSF